MGPGGTLAAGGFGLATLSMTIFFGSQPADQHGEVDDSNLQAP